MTVIYPPLFYHGIVIITSELLRFASLVLAGFFGREEDGGVVGEVADGG